MRPSEGMRMAFFDWRPEYGVGVPELDSQHRRLIGIINQLHDTIREGSRLSAVMAVIDELIEYAHFHFTQEELIMERASYDGLAEHHQKHLEMGTRLDEFRSAVDTGVARISIPVISFLRDWLAVHITKANRRYIAQVTASFKA